MTSTTISAAEHIRALNDAFRRTFVGGVVMITAGVASTPAVIMTMPPTKVRRKSSLRARMRSAVDMVVLVMAWSLEVGGWDGARLVQGMRGKKRGDPQAAPLSWRGRFSARHLPERRNSGWGTAMSCGRLLNGGYSGASNHSKVNSPWSIRFTVATQKPSNSRFSFQ